MTSPFDEIIDRTGVPALKVHPIILGENGKNLFAAGVADMDFKAPPPILAAMQKRLDHGIFGYETVPDNLMPALINWQKTRHNWTVDPKHVLRSPNILNALALAVRLNSNPGDGVIVQPPVFFDFFDLIVENQRQLIQNPLLLNNGRYTIDFDDLAKKVALPKTKILILCNPHNPVGRVWTRMELKKMGDICAANNVLVIADEIHADIVFSNHTYTPFATLGVAYAQNSITCISPAKSFNIPACTAAFTIISDDSLRKKFQTENSALTVNKNNAFASVAMEAAYGKSAPWLDDALTYIEGNIDLVRNRLTNIPYVSLIEPEGTFLLWLDFTKLELSPDDLTKVLRQKAKWAVTRGEAFGEQGEGFARLNIACPREKLQTALAQLKSALPA